MTRGRGPLCPDMPVKGALSQAVYCTASHGASSLDTEELPGPAGETGGWGRGGTKWHCRGVYSESSVLFLSLKCCSELYRWIVDFSFLFFVLWLSVSHHQKPCHDCPLFDYIERTDSQAPREEGFFWFSCLPSVHLKASRSGKWHAASVRTAPTPLLRFLFALMLVSEGAWMRKAHRQMHLADDRDYSVGPAL